LETLRNFYLIRSIIVSLSADESSPVPLVSLPLASEDVEMISDEEISEEEADSPSISGMQVMDEVNCLPAETLVLSAQEDSLDMDQFEPILSGSSDIESEEDMDIQVGFNHVRCVIE
jgi:hypothetical protein